MRLTTRQRHKQCAEVKVWKNTLLDAEKEMIKEAFLCGDDSEFHLNIPDIKSATAYMEYYRNCK